MNSKILNSVCFIRKYGKQGHNTEEEYEDRRYKLCQQMKYNNKYGHAATYLLQYDALVDEKFTDVIRAESKEQDEIGLWLEVVKDLVEDADMVWRGREGWSWDYYVDPGFMMSYKKDEKHKIIDTAMNRFYSEWGHYPKTIGSWLLDTETMEYLSEKYDADAFIICREQWGMDGYTLWGGPYYGAYYPSKNNMQTPAQSPENQINTPVFRMFINDPIYCYYEYAEEKYNDIKYGLFTQEPAWMCGQNPEWVRWQYDNIFKNNNVGFGYIQLGQESSFEWKDRVEIGLHMQMEFVKENIDDYGLVNMTVGEMGRLFKKQYKSTPMRAVGALTDWADKGNQSVWFNNKHYRVNVFSDKEQVWIRDIHIFKDEYRDKYLDEPCTTSSAIYDNPPIVDGIRMSDDNVKAGWFFGKGEIESFCEKDNCFYVSIKTENGNITIKCLDNSIEITGEKDFAVDFVYSESSPFVKKTTDKCICYTHNGLDYKAEIACGSYSDNKLISDNNAITINL